MPIHIDKYNTKWSNMKKYLEIILAIMKKYQR